MGRPPGVLWALVHRFIGSKRCSSSVDESMPRILILLPSVLLSAALTELLDHLLLRTPVLIDF